VLAQAEPALKIFFFKMGQKFEVFLFTFELICMLLKGYLKIITLRGFFGIFKMIKIFGFLAQTQPA
jgi:hypothetical protein